MSKFWWEGIDSAGKWCKGYLVAESYEDLKEQLLRCGVALLSYKNSGKKLWEWRNKLTRYDFIEFFEQVAILIDGGVDLLSAIKIIEQQTKIGAMRDVLISLIKSLQDGKSFAVALESYKYIFNDFVIQMVRVGQHSGNLGFVFTQISLYLKKNKQLKKDLINAALMPMFTIFFALLIVLIILMIVVPQFQIFFSSMGKQIPTATKRIIAVSNFLRSKYGMYFFVLMCAVFWSTLRILGRLRVKKFKDRFLLNIPYVKDLVELSNITYFTQALTILLKSGIPIKDAVVCAKDSVNNFYLREHLDLMLEYINVGRSLSESMAFMPKFYKQDNLIALIKVGEQTGSLVGVLNKACDVFQEELKRFIVIVEAFFQPILLIIVGLIIGLLIWMIYLPIFNLAYSLN